jgi:hypothetical protein
MTTDKKATTSKTRRGENGREENRRENRRHVREK